MLNWISCPFVLLQVRECVDGCSWQAAGHVSCTSSQSFCRKLPQDGAEAVRMQWNRSAMSCH